MVEHNSSRYSVADLRTVFSRTTTKTRKVSQDGMVWQRPISRTMLFFFLGTRFSSRYCDGKAEEARNTLQARCQANEWLKDLHVGSISYYHQLSVISSMESI